MALTNGYSQRFDYLCPNELFGMMSYASQEALLATDFAEAPAGGWCHSTAYSTASSSFLSFTQGERVPCSGYLSSEGDQEECDVWIDAMDQNYYQLNQFELRLIENQISAAQLVSGYSSVGCSPVKGSNRGHHQKRARSDHNLPSPKKRSGADKQSPCKDPQSIAAKNRRERISERLKILQNLVPNGTKVDLVTMLEKAINYVKFLQLQVKVLASDEYWPAQGGRALDVAQVKEAIEAIVASQRDGSSFSSQ